MTGGGPKRLLALDGGGLMGLISIGYLCEIERQLRETLGEGPDFRLRDYFDYFGGTSTGAIIAAALALGRSAEEIKAFYLTHGPAMFTPASIWSVLRSGFSHRYDHRHLAAMLKQEFSDRSILDLQKEDALRPGQHLMVVLRNTHNDSTWALSTNPDDRYNAVERPNCNRLIPLWQIVRASTAAPFYFQPEQIGFPDGSMFSFVDGGLTPHNNPALKLFQMATLPAFQLGWETGVENMLIVSIGTGYARDPIPKPRQVGAAIHRLAARTPSDLMRGANVAIDMTCRTVGHCLHGHEIDRQVGAMMTDGRDAKAFSYVRYNADVSAAGQEKLGVPKQMSPLKMDDVSLLNHFRLIGDLAGKAEVNVKDHFSSLF